MNAAAEIGTPGGSGRLLTPAEAAAHVGLSIQTLANFRTVGGGPVYFKLSRFVRYDEADLNDWMRRRRFTSTSQERAG
jgi:predicted DNA-binding transcriptional regulator AlpA